MDTNNALNFSTFLQAELFVPSTAEALILRNSEIVLENVKILDPLNLQLLDLSYAQMFAFNAELQKHGLTQDISSNNVNGDFLNPLTNLIVINLLQSKITTLETAPFSKQQKLKQLIILENNIPVIHQHSFKGLISLESLDLHSMTIEKLQKSCFYDLLSLRTLNLSDNRLDSLQSNTFYGLQILNKLDLRNNKVRSMGLQTFRHISGTIHVEDHNMCCFVEQSTRCTYHANEGGMNCDPVMDHLSEVCYILLITYLIICGALNVSLQVTATYQNAQIVAILLFTCNDALISLQCLSDLSINWYYQHNYPLIRHHIKRHILCIVYGSFSIVTEILPRVAFVLLAFIYLRITTAAMTKQPHSVIRVSKSIGIAVLIILGASVAMVTQIQEFRDPFCTPFERGQGQYALHPE